MAQPQRPAQCPTCSSNVLHRYLIADVPRESMHCQHHVVTYPEATDCPYFAREPGTD